MNTRTSSANSNRPHAPQGGLVRTILALVAFAWVASPAWATDRYWTSGANNGRWSDPNNWDPVGIPQNDDDLWFGYRPVDITGSGNDLTTLRIHNLHFADTDDLLTGNTLTIANALVSEGRDHQVVIKCPFVFLGNATVQVGSSAGFLGELQSYLDLEGPLVVNAPHSVELDAQANDSEGGGIGVITISGPISGNGDIEARTKVAGNHAGVVSFRGLSTNAFSGRMHLDAPSPSQIEFNNMYLPVVTNRLVVDYGKTANLMLYSASQIANTTTIEVDGGGQLIMKGYNVTVNTLVFSNYTADAAASTLDTGSITLGLNGGIFCWNENQSFVPTIKGTVNLNGFLPFDIGGISAYGLDLQASIEGNGFEKLGTGTLRLSGNNTFFGDAEITAGTVEADTATAFGQAGPTYGVELNGGNLVLQGVAIGAEPLFVNSAVSFLTAINQCIWAGPVGLNADFNVVPLDVTASGLKLNFSGSISGSGGLNLQSALFGVGNVQLSGPTGNLFTGPTTVNCQLLELNKSSGVNAYSGPLIVGGAAGSALHEARWLQSYQNVGATATLYANGVINLNNHNEDFGPVTFNGGKVGSGPFGQFAIYAPLTVNPSSSSAVINGNLGLPPGADRVFMVGDGASDCDLLVNAVVFGSPGTYFVKQGAGTMCLANVNSFDAPTLLEEGILDISNGSSLGTWPGLVIFDGATLRVSGAGTGGGFEAIGAGVGGTHGAVEILPNASFTFAGGMLLDGPTTFNVGQSGGLALNGAISSSGPGCSVIKTGTGTLIFGGAANNTYSGDTTVKSGGLYLGKSANYISVPGNLIIGPAAGPTAFARLGQVGGLGGTTVTVNANSLFDLFGNYQSLTTLNLRDGGSVQTGVGLLDFPSGGAINVGSLNAVGSHASSSITGAIGLPANASLSFHVNQYSPFFPFASGSELEVSAAIPRPVENLGFAPAGITKNGFGQMRLSGNNTYAGSTVINAGTLWVDGAQPQSLVAVNSGILGGSGTVGDIYMTGSSAVVAPGDGGPGILTCGNLNAGITASGVLRMELNGTTAGSGYDQLNVRGTVNLAGVALERSLGFSPPTGAQFEIINNDGSDAVTGTFNGLPDSGKLYISGVLYQINYSFGGKPGNDVALQGLDTPPPPILVIEKIPPTSLRLLWPTIDPPFSLQTTTNLLAANWIAALPLPVVVGTNNVVTNTANNSRQFYRLSNP